jgi:hypothetical protein
VKCRFQTIAPATHRCSQCNFITHSRLRPERLDRKCPAGDLAGQIAARLRASGAEIERRLAICRPCENFLGDNCRLMKVTPDCPRELNSTYLDALCGVDGDCIGCPQGRWRSLAAVGTTA